MKSLDSQSWMKALASNSRDPTKWSTMALWKHNLNEILGRIDAIKNADDPNYDETRVDLEPRRNPPRQVQLTLAAKLRAALRSSSQSSTSSALPALSPTSSERLRLPSPAGGSLLSQGDAFSPFSGFSDEGRSINKHRPDEALINMTMLLLVQGACLPLLQQPSHKDYAWSIVHKQYSITMPNPANQSGTKTILTARTDGYLQAKRPGCLPDDNDALAIIEVKPYRRHNPPANLKAVRIQEGAEMASWISAESTKGLLPPNRTTKTYRRLLISQDFDHVFLTIAEYDDQYVEYVGGTVNGPKSDLPPLPQLTIPKRRGGTVKAIKKKTSRILGALKPKSPITTAPPSPTAAPMDEPEAVLKDEPEAVPKDEPEAVPKDEPEAVPKDEPEAVPKDEPEAVPKDDRPTAAPTDEPEAAPKWALGSGPNPGFLRMIEFKGFDLGKETDVRKLTILLYSLTDYLVSKDLALRGQ